jgi:hypothetical protein
MREAKTLTRRRAIRRGLEFIYRVASDPQHVADYGSDLLNCFHFISATSLDAELRRMARRMGQERARAWRRNHPALPRKADADTIADLMHGAYAATRLGEDCANLRAGIGRAARRFPASDYLWFDPEREPPPGDIPEACECGALSPRGRKTCRKCRRRLRMMSRYWVFMDALTRSYTGECYGILLGASYRSVIKWLPRMRPYPGDEGAGKGDFYEQIYAVTHVVYTLNDYSTYRLSPRWLPQEYEFLKNGLGHAMEMHDAEMTGEIMDSLRAFGHTSRHPQLREGMEYLLAEQHADGSWGDLDTEDIYQRYHPTWTAIDGLREYRWRGERLGFPKLLPLLKAMNG